MQVSNKLRFGGSPEYKHYMHWCPGCEEAHVIYTDAAGQACWAFDGNVDAPTFSPSVRCDYGDGRCCHYFLKQGRLEFCADSTHHLAGQTVDLPDLPVRWQDAP